MSTTPCEKPDDPGPDAPGPTDCIAAFETGEGNTVIYSQQNNTAWVEGDNAVSLDTIR